MDRLIAGKKAVPMIVVMPDAHALAPGAAGFDDYGPANSDALCRELVEDILPLVEGSYKVLVEHAPAPLPDFPWAATTRLLSR